MRVALGIAGMLSCAADAAACPVCVTEAGRRVRAGIGGADFGPNLWAVLLPFPVLLAIVAAIHFGPPLGGGNGGDRSAGSRRRGHE